MQNSFANWLENIKFVEHYAGTDDNMREAFEAWLETISIDDWFIYGQEYAEDYADLQKSKRV